MLNIFKKKKKEWVEIKFMGNDCLFRTVEIIKKKKDTSGTIWIEWAHNHPYTIYENSKESEFNSWLLEEIE